MTSFATPHGIGLRREAVTEANGNVRMGALYTTFFEVRHGDQKRKASLPCGVKRKMDDRLKARNRAFFSPNWRKQNPAVIADFPLEGTF